MMKTTICFVAHAFRNLVCTCAIVLSSVPVMCHAEFSGRDSLACDAGNWRQSGKDDLGRFSFQNSKLDFRFKSSDDDHDYRTTLHWTRNKGSYDHDWFVQAHVHLETGYGLSLGVVDSQHADYGYMVSILHRVNHDWDKDDFGAFQFSTVNDGRTQRSITTFTTATLRLHFDSTAKTLTGSWRTRGVWSYFKPVSIDYWDMEDSGRFTAILRGSGGPDSDDPPHWYGSKFNAPGTAYFKDFICGDAAPEIEIEQPPYQALKAGVSKRSFGTVSVGGPGVSRIFTIRNSGTAMLTRLKILGDGAGASDFRISAPSATRLVPGGSTTFKVTFRPKAAGTRKAVLHVHSNDPNVRSFDFHVAGMGVRQ